MAARNNEVKFALEFPQGLIIAMQGQPSYGSTSDIGGVYFQPAGSSDAFMVWGERKELFGKHAINVGKNNETGGGGYSVVHEFAENGALIDCRLIKGTETLRGVLASEQTVQALNAALAQDKIKLYDPRDTELAKVFNVASFPDGRLLVQLQNKNELYLGTPGNYEKLDAKLQAQGGCSMYYKLATGESIELPYGFGQPGQNDIPKFNGEELTYLRVNSPADPKKFGLDLAAGVAHLDPFSPQVQKPAAPKPPGR